MEIIVLEKKVDHGKELTTGLLQDSIKKGENRETRTLAKLIECTEEEIHAIQLAFEHTEKLAHIDFESAIPHKKEEEVLPKHLQQGLPIGAAWTIIEIAKRLGITEALGDGEAGQIALLQIIATILHPSLPLLSPLASTTLKTCKVLNLPSEFNEVDYKNNLLWLSYNQEDIENSIYQKLERKKEDVLYLYDITSTYFSKKENPLEIFYESQNNSPIIGLFCDKEGTPLSINILEDCTQNNFSMRLKAISLRFKAKCITFVGNLEIPGRPKNAKPPLYKISSVQTNKAKELVKEHILEKKLADGGVIEGSNGHRYIIKREIHRFRILAIHRLQQQKQIKVLIEKNNNAIQFGQVTKPGTIIKKINQVIAKIKASSWMNASQNGEQLKLQIDQRKLQELLYLDGCIVLETNIPEADINAERILERYHNLHPVNNAFSDRTLSLPNAADLEEHTFQLVQGHNLILMMSYSIHRYLSQAWKNLEITPDEALKQLSNICAIECEDQIVIPIPNQDSQNLLQAINLNLPRKL